MYQQSPFNKILRFFSKRHSWGLISLGFGIGIIIVVVLPVNVWLILLGVGSIAYGIYCIAKYLCD